MSNYVKLATDAGDQYLTSLSRDARELPEDHDCDGSEAPADAAGRDAARVRGAASSRRRRN